MNTTRPIPKQSKKKLNASIVYSFDFTSSNSTFFFPEHSVIIKPISGPNIIDQNKAQPKPILRLEPRLATPKQKRRLTIKTTNSIIE